MLKKLFISVLLCTSVLLTGCDTIDGVVSDAKRVQEEAGPKIAEIKAGIENVVDKTQDAYDAILQKKEELDELVQEVSEATAAINKLLGKEDTSEESKEELLDQKEELQKTIAELQAVLDEANSALQETEEAETTTEEVEPSN